MRGQCKVLAQFMAPHFKTVDEVVKEVHKRWQAKQKHESYETPGLGSRRSEAPK